MERKVTFITTMHEKKMDLQEIVQCRPLQEKHGEYGN
jgi:hypothetical protein